jgi:hypothetical protein
MTNLSTALIAAVSLVILPAPAPAPTVTAAAPIVTTTTSTTLVAPSVMAEWGKVAWCETNGDWKHQGSLFEGGLGILAWNWRYYGGTVYAAHAWLATPEQQVAIAVKIQQGLPTPDQNGECHGW